LCSRSSTFTTNEASTSAAAEWGVLEKKVQAFWRCETKAIGVVDYAMEVYMRSVLERDTNLLPFCLGAVGCAVVMVSVEAKRREKERTKC
jgi:hypothetical protein